MIMICEYTYESGVKFSDVKDASVLAYHQSQESSSNNCNTKLILGEKRLPSYCTFL